MFKNKLLLVALLMLLSSTAQGYTTYCEVINGQAKGFVIPEAYQSFSVSGSVRFFLYGEYGELLNTETEYAYGYVYGEAEEVETIYVNSDVQSCTFDVTAAVSGVSPSGSGEIEIEEPTMVYTRCELANGRAVGYAKTDRYKSVMIVGKVYFRFYDARLREIKRESEFETDYVDNDEEPVSSTRAPAEATSCTFDLS